MIEIDLWDGTRGIPRPIARLGVNEDNKLEVIAGQGKVEVSKVTLGGESKSIPKGKCQVYITNLSMPVDLDPDFVIGENE